MGGDDIKTARVEWEPADRLRRVHDGHHPVLVRRPRDRVEVGDLACRHLNRAERDDIHVGADLAGQLRGRHQPHGHTAALVDEEGEEERGELDVGR